jgi:hypothetical protein
VSYESRGCIVGAIAGVECKIKAPKVGGDPYSTK